MPRTSVHLVVPAGTQIQAVLKNLFSSATKPGDAMLAFVTDPLVVNGSTAIPAGSRLNGVVEQITNAKSQAVTWLRFKSVVIDETPLHIETDRVLTNGTVESDFEILGNAADTLTEAGIGAAMGAAGRNRAGINAGLSAGAMRGAAAVNTSNIKITVTLAEPLEIIR